MTNQLVAKGEAPQGWVWARLGDIVEFEYGKGLRKDRRDIGGRVPVYGSNGILGYHSDSLVRYPCVVIGRKGAIGQVHLSKTPCWPIDTTYYVCPPDCISLAFSYLLLCYLRLGSLDRSTAIPGLNRDDAYRLAILVPPLAEQDRIVARIEELFTRLDAGVEALTKIKTQLKRYRQAILKHAFEGKLTAAWREARKHELEPAAVLLERIRAERQHRMKSKSRTLPSLNTSDLPDLPEGWVWSSFEELKRAEKNAIKAGPFGSSLRKGCYVPHGYKVYGQEQVIRQNPFYGDYYVDDAKYAELRSCAVRPGDILISLVGTIGRALVLPKNSEEGIINPRLVKLSLEEGLVDKEYVKAYIESSAVRDFFTLASHGGTMGILNLSILRTLPIPVPSLAEQQRIVEEIECRFSIVDQIQTTVEQGLKQAERLRQSILKRAFEGKLVPQDPNDEPAEILLERIGEQRVRMQSGARFRNVAGRKTTTQEMRLM